MDQAGSKEKQQDKQDEIFNQYVNTKLNTPMDESIQPVGVQSKISDDGNQKNITFEKRNLHQKSSERLYDRADYVDYHKSHEDLKRGMINPSQNNIMRINTD